MMLSAARQALRVLGSPVRRRLAGMELAPPLEFACRIEALPDGCSTIDNRHTTPKGRCQW